MADPEGGERAVITLDGKYLRPNRSDSHAQPSKDVHDAAGLVLIGLNMRPLLTSVGPLLRNCARRAE